MFALIVVLIKRKSYPTNIAKQVKINISILHGKAHDVKICNTKTGFHKFLCIDKCQTEQGSILATDPSHPTPSNTL